MSASKIPSLFNINLLVHHGEKEKLYSKLIKWALSSGKFIVIFVEIITISAFVYRYKLDGDLSDLQDQINNQKIPYIKSLKADELLIKNTQFQINSISKLKSEKADFISPLNNLSKIIPQSIKLTNISFDRSQTYPKTTISLTGQSPSNMELSIFIKELQKNPNFSDINLTNISFENQTTFTITGTLASTKGRTN
ncbi:MAG: PilN domain-containing protein [Candidatus Daviesbacteria bacterium]|nr:PilN domain-containing protein [Candidatus Daviesbacteria bacterium]